MLQKNIKTVQNRRKLNVECHFPNTNAVDSSFEVLIVSTKFKFEHALKRKFTSQPAPQIKLNAFHPSSYLYIVATLWRQKSDEHIR